MIDRFKKANYSFVLSIFFFFLMLISIPLLTGDYIGGDTPIGYEMMPDGETLHFWNEIDDYYLNMSSGNQFSNYYGDYWTHNIFCAGYKTSDWNYLCTDDLPIELTVYSDNATYVQINGTRTVDIAGRNIGMGINYLLENNDKELNITVGLRHLSGSPITTDIGFAWRVNQIKINGNSANDYLIINDSSYDLSGELDLMFRNMTKEVVKYNSTWNGNCESYCDGEGYNDSCSDCYDVINYTVDEQIPFYKIKDMAYVGLRWKPNLNYFVQVQNKTGQDNAPVTLAIVTTGLDVGQTKQTSFFWRDPAPTVELIYPEDDATDLSSTINFTAHLNNSDTYISNFTLYTDTTGSWAINQTQYPELPSFKRNDILNNLDMSTNIGYWRLNNQTEFGENSTHVFDFSGNGNNGTGIALEGNEIGYAGLFGGCFNPNAAGEYITLLDNSGDLVDVPTTYDWGVSFWAYATGYGESLPAISWDGSDDIIIYPYDNVGGDGVRIFWRDVGANIIDENGATRTGWNHYVFTSHANNDHRLYVNGVNIVNATDSGASSGSSDVRIGGNVGSGQYYKDLIDEVAIFNETITPEFAQKLYNISKDYYANFTVIGIPDGTYDWNILGSDNESSMAFADANFTFTVGSANSAPTHTTPIFSQGSHTPSDNITCLNQSTADADSDAVTNTYNWLIDGSSITIINLPFELDDSSVTKDYSGNGNNGSLEGGLDILTNGIVGGNARLQSADNEYINVTNNYGNITGGDFTFALWARQGGSQASLPVLSQHDGDGTGRNIILWYSANCANDEINTYLGGSNLCSQTTPTLGVYYHVVITYNGTELKIYIDGSEENTTTKVVDEGANGNILLGTNKNAAAFFNGRLDQFKVYNITLTPEQIFQLYDDEKDGYSNSSTMVSSETLNNENWTCQVTPSDFIIDGIMKQNSTLITKESFPYFGNADIGLLEKDSWTTWAFKTHWIAENVTSNFDEQGTTIWFNNSEGEERVAGHTVGADTNNYNVWILDASNGGEICTYTVNSTDRTLHGGTLGHGWGGAVYYDNKLYSAYWDIFEINATNCELIQTFNKTSGEAIDYSQAVQVNDDYVVAVSFNDSYITVLNRTDFSEIWSINASDIYGWDRNGLSVEPLCDFNELSCVISSSTDGSNSLIKVNVTNGESIWNSSAGLNVGFWDSAPTRATINGEDLLFLVTQAGGAGSGIYSVYWDNGTVRNFNDDVVYGSSTGTPIVTDDKMWVNAYMANGRGRVKEDYTMFRAYNASNLSQIICEVNDYESFETKAFSKIYQSYSQPILVDDIIFGSKRFNGGASADGYTYGINETNCDVLFRYHYDDIDMYGYPIVANGTLVQMTSTYDVYAFDLGVGSSEWHRLGFDNNLSATAPVDAVQDWRYLKINCTKTEFMEFNCTATNLYNKNITYINFTHGSQFEFNWFNSTGHSVANATNLWEWDDTLEEDESINFRLERTTQNITVENIYPTQDLQINETDFRIECNITPDVGTLQEATLFLDIGDGTVRNYTLMPSFDVPINPSLYSLEYAYSALEASRHKLTTRTCEDSEIKQNDVDENFEGALTITVWGNTSGLYRKMLLKFPDLPTSWLEGKEILNDYANELPKLEINQIAGTSETDGLKYIQTAEVLKPWVAGQVTWNQWKSDNGWGVVGAENTTLERIRNELNESGADYINVTLTNSSLIGVSNETHGWQTYDDILADKNFTQMIQSWFDNPGNETYGLILYRIDGSNNAVHFDSCENETNYPRLTFHVATDTITSGEDYNFSVPITLPGGSYKYACLSRSVSPETFGWSNWTDFTIQTQQNHTRNIFNSFSLTLILDRLSNFWKYIKQEFSLTDILARIFNPLRSFIDTFSLSDIVGRLSLGLIVVTNVLNVNEARDSRYDGLRTNIQALTISDILNRFFFGILDTTQDININDDVDRRAGIGRFVDQAISFGDYEIPTNGLISWWTMDNGDSNATHTFDIMGNNHGSLDSPTEDTGYISESFSYDGIDDVIVIGDRDSLSINTTDELSFSMWLSPATFNFTGTSNGYAEIIGKGETGESNVEYGWRLYNNTGEGGTRPKRMSFYVWNLTGGLGAGSYFQDELNENEWIHVVAVVNETHIKLYKNGVLRDTDTLGGGYGIIPGNGDSTLQLGSRDDNYFFNGSIDEVLIYSRSLTGAEVLQIYQSTSNERGGIFVSRLFSGKRLAIQDITLSNIINRLFLGTLDTTQDVNINLVEDDKTGMARLNTQFFSISDAISRLFNNIRNPTQSFSMNNIINRLFFGTRLTTQDVNINLLEDDKAGIGRQTIQTFSINDLVSSLYTDIGVFNNRTLFQTFTMNDAMNRIFNPVRNPTQTFSINDILNRLFFGILDTTQDININDDVDRGAEIKRDTTQTFTINDALNRIFNSVRNPTQTFTINDIINRLFLGTLDTTQDVNINENVDRKTDIKRDSIQTFSINNFVNEFYIDIGNQYNRTLTQAISVAEGVERFFIGLRIQTQEVVVNGITNRFFFGILDTTQDININDSVIRSHGSSVTTSQTFSFNLIVDRLRGVNRGITETISINLVVDRAGTFYRLLSDILNFVINLATSGDEVPAADAAEGFGQNILKRCFLMEEDYTCDLKYYEKVCPIKSFENLEDCEEYAESKDKIPRDIKRYLDYFGKALAPNNQSGGKVIVVILLGLILFSSELIILIKLGKDKRIKQKW